MDHVWDTVYEAEVKMGFSPNIHHLQVWAGSPLALALTAQVCTFSLEHGPGAKVVIGSAFMRRAQANALSIEAQSDS